MCALALGISASCDKDDPVVDPNGNEETPGSGGQTGGKDNTVKIERLYQAVMRRILPYPYSIYVMRMADGKDVYLFRYKYNQDLHEGDKIAYKTANGYGEVVAIGGVKFDENGSDGSQNPDVPGGEYWVASDPIEATVKDIFYINVKYSLLPTPQKTAFIETTDGNLVYVKTSKLSVEINKGDQIVYNVYTLVPNEILALKKL